MTSNASSTDSPRSTDSALLADFVRRHSDRAFAVLVNRYAPLVYGATLRRCQVPQLAEEAAQNTFAILARKASFLRGEDSLAGWLHRTATFEASKILRAETRHLRKMHALSNEPNDPNGGTNGDQWGEIKPLLDEALQKLSKGDRDLVLWRYYHGFKLPEIARKTGKTLAATQKQSQRALSRLARFLKGRGATGVTTSVVAAALTSVLHSPVKAGFAAGMAETSLTASAAVPTVTLLTNTLLTMSSVKLSALTAITVFGLALIPLGYQRAAIVKEERRLADLEKTIETQRHTVIAHRRPSLVDNVPPPPAPTPIDQTKRNPGTIDLSQLADDLLAAQEQRSVTALVRSKEALEVISAKPDASLDQLFERISRGNLSSQKRDLLIDAILAEMQDARPGKALKIIEGFLRNASADSDQRYMIKAERALGVLARKDPEGAIAWYESALEEGLFQAKSLHDENASVMRASASVFVGLHEVDAEMAAGFYESLETDAQGVALQQAAIEAQGAEDRHQLAQLAASLPDAQKQSVFESMAHGVARQHGASAETARMVLEWADESVASNGLLVKAARALTEDRLAELDQALEWITEHSEAGQAEANAGKVLGHHATYEQRTAHRKFESMREAGASDAFAAAYIQGGQRAFRDPVGTLNLIHTFTHPDVRAAALQAFAEDWREQPDRLTTYLRDSPLPEAEVQALLEP